MFSNVLKSWIMNYLIKKQPCVILVDMPHFHGFLCSLNIGWLSWLRMAKSRPISNAHFSGNKHLINFPGPEKLILTSSLQEKTTLDASALLSSAFFTFLFDHYLTVNGVTTNFNRSDL